MQETKKCSHCKKLFCREKKHTNYVWGLKKYCSKKCMANFFNKKYCGNDLKIKKTSFYRKRFEIFKRDNFRCFYCGRSTIEDLDIKLEVEHINPRNGVVENWEKASIDDLITSCKECNVGKFNSTLSIEVIKRIREEIKRRKND